MVNCRLLSVLAVALALVVGQATIQAADEEGFTKLFNGKDMTGFKIVPDNAKEAFQVKDDMIVVTGKPNGYFATEKPYKNFVLRYDWRYKRPADLADETKFGGNSGLLVYIQEPHKVWPKCVEVQGMNRDHGNIFAIGGAKGTYKKDAAAQKQAIKPVGEWNTTEVTSMNGKLTCKINGMLVCEGQTEELTGGPLGWQSEGAELHFRNLQIKELK